MIFPFGIPFINFSNQRFLSAIVDVEYVTHFA